MPTTDTASDDLAATVRIDRGVEYDAPDGTTLAANVFRPDRSDAVPALLQRTPYGAPDFPTDPFAVRALDAGYAVVIADTRGRGGADGEFSPWTFERADGARTVEWISARPWCTGRVGMFGGSSAATTQLLAAAERPDGLTAIAPQFAPSDIHGSDFFQDGAMSALTLISWTFGWIVPHTADRLVRRDALSAEIADEVQEACYDALEAIPELARHRPLRELPTHVLADVSLPESVGPADLAPHWDLWLSHPDYDAFWRSFDAEQLYDEMDVPGLHITGWHDLCQQGTVTNYRGMRAATDAPQFLIVGPWAHRNQTELVGDVDFGPRAAADAYDWTDAKLAFFDEFVRSDRDTRFGDGPFAETFAMSPTGGEWTTHADWPPRDAAERVWYPKVESGTGVLSETPPSQGTVSYVHDPTNPVPTRGGPLCCRDATREPGMFEHSVSSDRDDVLTFTSPPLSESLRLAGPVTATLTVSSDAPETDFTTKLLHLSNGRAYNLCDGVRRGRISDEPTTLTVSLWNVHHVVEASDRLQLRVASSNSPRFDPHPGTTEPWRTETEEVKRAEQTLHFGPSCRLSVTVG